MPRPRRTEPPSIPPEESSKREESGFYEAYGSFARALRLWFLAYGIGGPTLVLTNEAAWQKVASTGSGLSVAYAFLGGVTLQIILALVYKSAMWYLYLGEFNPTVRDWQRYKIADWISERYWLELLGDVITLGLFAGATFRLVDIVSH